MSDDLFKNARLKEMRNRFKTAVREGQHHVISDPARKKLEERVAQMKERAQAHLNRHTPAWVAKENSKLVSEHKGKLKPSLSPKWILQTETSPAALAQRAFQNVEHRNTQRMEKIERIAERMRRRLTIDSRSPRQRNGMSM